MRRSRRGGQENNPSRAFLLWRPKVKMYELSIELESEDSVNFVLMCQPTFGTSDERITLSVDQRPLIIQELRRIVDLCANKTDH